MTFQPTQLRKPAVTFAGTKPTTPVSRHTPMKTNERPTRSEAIMQPARTVGTRTSATSDGHSRPEP